MGHESNTYPLTTTVYNYSHTNKFPLHSTSITNIIIDIY
jgi:hypothetical protein